MIDTKIFVIISIIFAFGISYFASVFNVFSYLDLVVVVLFSLSSIIIIFSYLKIFSKQGEGILFSAILLGVFPLMFALGEIAEFLQKLTNLEILELFETLSTLIGAVVLIYSLSVHLKSVLRIKEIIPEVVTKEEKSK